tara:strand:- start:1097 stop:1249 length:153 start_codon:yes stop_codon:yes gene_type:complete
MGRAIRILEVPILLLCMAGMCWSNGSDLIAISLLVVSLVRLWINDLIERR